MKYHTTSVGAGKMVITAKVGGQEEPSTIRLPNTTITANQGEWGGSLMVTTCPDEHWGSCSHKCEGRCSYMGGGGYSGGGSGGVDYQIGDNFLKDQKGFNGGSNGGNGEGDPGFRDGFDGRAKGTGENIADYSFKNFKLSPGEGGRYHYYSYKENSICTNCNRAVYYGGGGGGVLVDSKGPTATSSQGKGYGGGGGAGCLKGCNTGLPGVILLEVVKVDWNF